MSRNEITGDKLQSKVGNTEAFNEGYDRIFAERKRTPPCSSYDDATIAATKEAQCNHWVAGWDASPTD